MALNVITSQSVKEYVLPASEALGPIQVSTLVKKFTDTLESCLPDAGGKTQIVRIKEYLLPLYRRVILDAKKFKSMIQIHTESATPSGKLKVPGFPVYTELQCEMKLLCAVVRGTAATSVRSQIVKVGNQEVLVVTPKVLSAIITVSMVGYGLHKDVQPAYLAANIYGACTVAACAKEQHNWGLHGHAGINFVANVCYNIWKRAEDEKAGTGNATLAEMQFPTVESFFFVAYKLDRTLEGANTLTSVIQSTGVSAEILNSFLSLYRKEEWGIEMGGARVALANGFFAAMKNLEAGTSTSSTTAPKKNFFGSL